MVHSSMHLPGSMLESPNNIELFGECYVGNIPYFLFHVCDSLTTFVLTWLKKLKKIEPCVATRHVNSHVFHKNSGE